MRALAVTWLRVLAATWPAVLAWYLAGATVRETVLLIASQLGPRSALAAFLLLPLAALARLTAYVGMFFACRRALPAITALAAGREPRRTVAEFTDVLTASIVPFFALYGVTGLLSADVSSYANRAARIANPLAPGYFGFLDPGAGPLVVAVIVVAYLARLALSRFGERLPRWTVLLGVYLEAVWVFVAVRGLVEVAGTAYVWVRERRVVAWWLDARDWLRHLADPVRVAIDGVDGLVPVLLQVVALPLAWLLLAGVVYTRSLATIAEERIVPKRVEVRLRALLGRLPAPIARRSSMVTEPWDSVYRPFSVAARLVLRAAPGGTVLLLVVSALLHAGQQWGVLGLTRLVGPQSIRFWIVAFPVVTLAVTTAVETLRIPLLGAGFDGALAAWSARRALSPPVAPAPAGAASAGPSPSTG